MRVDLVPDQVRAFLGAAFPLRTTLPGQIFALRILLTQARGGAHLEDLARVCSLLAVFGPAVPSEGDISVQATAARVDLLVGVLAVAAALPDDAALVEVATTPCGHRLAPRSGLGPQRPDFSQEADPPASEGLGKILPLRRVTDPGVPVEPAPSLVLRAASPDEVHLVEDFAGVISRALEGPGGAA